MSYLEVCSKYLDRQAWANSIDLDQMTADQFLYCFPTHLAISDAWADSQMDLHVVKWT